MAKKEEKKEESKEAVKAPMKGLKANEEIFRLGMEVEVENTKFLVKEIKGVDVILARKDYK